MCFRPVVAEAALVGEPCLFAVCGGVRARAGWLHNDATTSGGNPTAVNMAAAAQSPCPGLAAPKHCSTPGTGQSSARGLPVFRATVSSTVFGADPDTARRVPKAPQQTVGISPVGCLPCAALTSPKSTVQLGLALHSSTAPASTKTQIGGALCQERPVLSCCQPNPCRGHSQAQRQQPDT
jgi:hypothetical protein